MTKRFRVYLVTTASCAIEVEAETGDEAVELAMVGELPYAPYDAGFDIGDWAAPSELFPKWNRPEDDYEEVE